MGDRTPFVVGILAIVAVVAWLLLRGESAQTPNPTPKAGSTQLTGSAAKSAPEGPSLLANPTGTPALPPSQGPTAEDTFSEETRDDSWAVKTEAEITKRWKQIRGGKLETTECRQTQCKLVVSGPEQDVATSVADLEGPRGLHGFAENVLLTAPTKAADGTITLRVYAKFDR